MFLNRLLAKNNAYKLLLISVCFALYFVFAYALKRTEYVKLIVLYSSLFATFYFMLKTFKNNFYVLVFVAFLSRFVFILAIPNLSQDFYRFIWDGRILLEGINPYLNTVTSFISKGVYPVSQSQVLYEGMGPLNAGHFTNYPPINQLCFFIAALFSGKSILGAAMVFRLLIICADFGTLYFGKKILEHLNLSVYNIFWYLLNPFIIIELTGNLHFEGVMIFFLIWSLYLLLIGKWQWSAVVLALSISVKLIPLIFLPLFFKFFVFKDDTSNSSKKYWIGVKKLIIFYAITLCSTLILFAPFFSLEFVNNYAQTVKLWFQNFEFNASIYYVARAIGYTFRGYNEIGVIGKITPIVVVLFILIKSFFGKTKSFSGLITAMLIGLSFYFFTTTTVHPWYVATLLILSVFTNYKFPLVWSFVIILSYLAYINIDKADKSENLWIIAIEYIIVYAVLIWDIIKQKTSKSLNYS